MEVVEDVLLLADATEVEVAELDEDEVVTGLDVVVEEDVVTGVVVVC